MLLFFLNIVAIAKLNFWKIGTYNDIKRSNINDLSLNLLILSLSSIDFARLFCPVNFGSGGFIFK